MPEKFELSQSKVAEILKTSQNVSLVREEIRLFQEKSTLINYQKSYAEAPVGPSDLTEIQELSKPSEGEFDSKTYPLLGAILNELNLGSSKITVQSLVIELPPLLDSVPEVRVFLPFAPDDTTKVVLFNWFSKNISSGVVLNFSTDPTVSGGLKISYKGVYKDYSIGPEINKTVSNILEERINNSKTLGERNTIQQL